MKMITIAPSYLANAKQQAYSVRDKISTSPFNEIYYSKSEFLDIWASCLGYSNWGAFDAITRNANTYCPNTIVITPATAASIADGIVSNSLNPQADYDSVLFIILESMSADERARFPDDSFEEAANRNKTISETPIELSLGYSGYSRVLANLLLNDGHVITIGREPFAKRLLDHAKELRQSSKLSKKEASLRSLDIYPHSGTPPEHVLDSAIDDGLVEILTDYDGSSPREYIKLTERALQYYSLEYTDDYSKEWIQWKRKFDKEWISSDRQKIPYANLKLMWQYHNDFSPLESVEHHSIPADSYKENPELTKSFETTERRGFNLKITESKWPSVVMTQTKTDIAESCFFYFMPRLYLRGLPNKLKDINLISFEAVSETGEALVIPDLEARKPFPNTNWIVACAKEHTKVGFYCTIPNGTKTIITKVKWKVALKDKTYLIDHTITMHLVYIPGNRFFSSENVSDFNSLDPMGLIPKESFGTYSVLGGQQIIGCAKNAEEYSTMPRIANANFLCELNDDVFTLHDEITIGSSIPVKSSYEIGY